MAYQLQPGLNIVQHPAVPPVCATADVNPLPQPTSLNYGSRPNTVLYGTAPYMAGKGSPAEFIETSDQLRPQTTSQFNKNLVETYRRGYFPLQNVECKVPLRTRTYEPSSTRANTQNGMFLQRYGNKNVSK
mgnify:CR=1 FL=1